MPEKNKEVKMQTRDMQWIRRNILGGKTLIRLSGKNVEDVILASKKNGSPFGKHYEMKHLDFTSNIGNLERVHSEFCLPLNDFNIQNIKSFENLHLVPSSLNLFAGKNSSGKSTILETIALLSNWANTKNTVYEGIAFKYDFGIKNFREFKSNFSSSKEYAIIDFKASNIDSEDTHRQLGNTKISFVLGGVSEDEDTLKYAPLNSIRFEYDNQHEFKILEKNRDDSSNTSSHIHSHDSYQPVHTIIEYQKNSVNSENYKEALDKGFNLLNFHGKVLEKLHLYKDQREAPYFIDDSLTYSPFSFPKNQMERFIKISQTDQKEVIKDKYSLPFVDVSIMPEELSQRTTRLYGCSFSSGSKEFKPIQHRDIDLLLGLNQNYLIRWLALDYIHQKNKSLSDNNSKGKDGLDFLGSIPDKVNNVFRNNKKFIELVNKEVATSNNPPEEALGKLFDKILNNLFHCNLKEPFKGLGIQSEKSFEYKFLGLFDCPQKGYSLGSNSENYKKIDMGNVLDWIQRGKPSLSEVGHNIKTRKKLMSLMSDENTIFDEKELEKLQSAYADFTESSLDLLYLADEAIVKISDEDEGDIADVLKGIYKDIDDLLVSSNYDISFYNDWEATKFRILEILSSYTLDSSIDMKGNKAVLFPFSSRLTEEYEIRNEHAHSAPSLFDHINANLKKSFENLFTTTFIGPLRERSDFKDDIFSYNYPFTLGIKGEKSGSFLSTFSDSIVSFISPNLIKDIEKGIKPNYQKHIKSGTYTEHLSEWLKFLELAEKIEVTATGAIKIYQGPKGEKNLSLDNIGVGVSQVLPVLLSCMASESDEEYELLLLEQPELHLHPSSQAKLADFFIAVSLSNKKTLFVETHSEHILNRLRLRKIQIKNDNELIKIFFSNKKKDAKSEIKEFTINEDGSYDFEAYPEGFFDQTQMESREIAKALIAKQTKKK